MSGQLGDHLCAEALSAVAPLGAGLSGNIHRDRADAELTQFDRSSPIRASTLPSLDGDRFAPVNTTSGGCLRPTFSQLLAQVSDSTGQVHFVAMATVRAVALVVGDVTKGFQPSRARPLGRIARLELPPISSGGCGR